MCDRLLRSEGQGKESFRSLNLADKPNYLVSHSPLPPHVPFPQVMPVDNHLAGEVDVTGFSPEEEGSEVR